MWQRIQTLFLLVSAILLIILFFSPLAVLQINDDTFYEIYIKGFVNENTVQYSYSLIFFNLIILLLNIIIIFLFKKRILQMRLCVYNFLLLLGIQGIIIYVIYSSSSKLNAEVFLEYSVILPIISAILHLLAFKYIKKDEELVRSADRIR